MMTSTEPEYLYLHVPFCRSICFYCDFCHQIYQKETAEKWLQAVEMDLKGHKVNPHLKTIYIGGGTPSALSLDELERLLSLLDPYRNDVIEYTVEINPETLDEKKAETLARHGVNRASIGFQSADPDILKLMNRHHTPAMCADCIEMLRKHGIENISLDLMYSLPTETMESLKNSVDAAIALQPDHLSLYSLQIEPGTVFAKKDIQPKDIDAEADEYEWICSYLPHFGYQQYEISNFAKDGRESIHNSAYWNYRDFYGIGAGASGKQGNDRYDRPKNLQAYLKDPLQEERIVLSRKDQMFEMLMMGTRFKRGMDRKLFQKTFGLDINAVYGKIIDQEIAQGRMKEDDSYLSASEKGYEILNDVLEDFL